MLADDRIGQSARAVLLGSNSSGVRKSVAGYISAWWEIFGPPRSRMIWVMTVARLPPALSPITPIRPASTPNSAAFSATQCTAAMLSSTAVGKR